MTKEKKQNTYTRGECEREREREKLCLMYYDSVPFNYAFIRNSVNILILFICAGSLN